MALARTRQATAVHRAVGFMAAGSPTRAMVELRRALHENSVCRAPLLNTNHSRKEVRFPGLALFRASLVQGQGIRPRGCERRGPGLPRLAGCRPRAGVPGWRCLGNEMGQAALRASNSCTLAHSASNSW